MYLYQLTAMAAGPCVFVFQASSELNVALSNLAAAATNVLAGITSTSVLAAPAAAPAAPAAPEAAPEAAPTAAPEAAPAAASVPAPVTTPTPAAAKIEYIQEAGPNEDFDAVCKRLQIYVMPGKKIPIVPQLGGITTSGKYHCIDLHPEDNVLAVYWNSDLAVNHGIRSAIGHLATIRGRVIKVRNDGCSKIFCYESSIGDFNFNAPINRDLLLNTMKILNICNGSSADTKLLSLLQTQLIVLQRNEKTCEVFSPQTRRSHTVLSTKYTFDEICEKFSLAKGNYQTQGCNTLLLRCGSDLYLKPDEKPVVHMFREGKKSLLVTNRGRLIWCVAIGSKNYCLDYPLGMDRNVSQEFLIGAVQMHLENHEDWSGVPAFCAAIYSLP